MWTTICTAAKPRITSPGPCPKAARAAPFRQLTAREAQILTRVRAGDRTIADWTFSSPFPETEVAVSESSSTNGLGANEKVLHLFRPTSVGTSIELGAYRNFGAVTDEELEFSIKVRYKQAGTCVSIHCLEVPRGDEPGARRVRGCPHSCGFWSPVGRCRGSSR